MSHYPSYYARQPGPPTQAPIASSMYSARPLAAQGAYTVMPGHNNALSHDHKHPQPPPKHPVQRQRSNSAQGQNQPHAAQPASSQPQMQSHQRPTPGGGQAGQQYGQVQQPYNPSYAQTRPVAGAPAPAPAPVQRGPVPYAGHQPYQTPSRAPISTHAPTHASPYSYPAPGQPQRTYSYPSPGQPVQQPPPHASGPGPYPPSAQSAYARGLSAFQQQQQRQQQQQHYTQPPATQPAPAPHQYARSAVPPAQIPPPASSGGRRPLPTPGPSGTSPSRERPISMPPQRSQTYQQPPSASPYSHSSSSSLSHIIPTSSFSSLSSAKPVTSSFPNIPRDTSPTRRPLPPPSPGPGVPAFPASVPTSSAPIGIPRSTNMHFQQPSSPSKSMPVNTYGNTLAGPSQVPSTSPQRRALPSSPNDQPNLGQLASGNLARRGTVSAMVSKFAGTNCPPSPTKSTTQAPPSASPYTPRAPVRSQTLPGTNIAPPAPHQTPEDMYEDDDPDASFSDEETASSAFDAAETESRASSEFAMSPQYGIRDLPRRSAFASGSASTEPQSPQYGILDLPRRAKSVYDRTRSWEQQSGQGAASSPWTSAANGSATARRGSVDIGTARNTAHIAVSPTKSAVDPLSIPPPKHPQTTSLVKPVSPISPSKSPQPQQPQQEQKLPMPPVRHPKPSRTERTPSWTLPTANLDRIQAQAQAQLPPVAEASGTSMAFKFATMSLNDEAGSARQAQTQGYKSTSSTPSSRQTSPTRPSAYEAAMQFKQAQKQKEKEEEERQQQARMQSQPRSQPPSHPSSRAPSPSKAYPPFALKTPRVAHANLDLSLDDAPPPSLRRSPSPSPSTSSSSVPSIPTIRTPDDGPAYGAASNQYASGRTAGGVSIPVINLPGDADYDDPPDNRSAYSDVSQVHAPTIVISPQPFSPQKVPVLNLPDDGYDEVPNSGPIISVSAPPASAPSTPAMPVILSDLANSPNSSPTKSPRNLPRPPPGTQTPSSSSLVSSSSSGSNVRPRGGGLVCGGCHKSIIGRIVSAMGVRWHPQCFKCCTCGELLEHVSSYEHDGKPYCHLDYHEAFAPQCYHCKTPIIDERFITLDDPALGRRAYHEQHFFCAECGDPFLAPSSPSKARQRPAFNSHSHPDEDPNEISIKGDGAFDVALDEDGDEVGFTVFRGHPYCETCHVRLRAPKCKACKRSIRDGMRAVEALGGKWCFECFVCAGCQNPFEDPSFFQRDKKPYCEPCFSLILRNEV